jgi:hypothetical protein
MEHQTTLPFTNVTLTFDWTTLFMGDVGEGALHEEEISNCQTKKIKPAPRRTGRLTIGRNITLTCTIALQITDPSSRQRERRTRKRKKVIVTQRSVKSGHLPQKGHETKTNWPTDCRSQYHLNLNLSQMRQ